MGFDKSETAETKKGIIIELEPIDLEEVKGAGEDQGMVATFLGKKNRILLGEPRHRSYLAGLLAKGERLPDEVENQVRNGFDYHQVTTSLTLLPDRGCSFLSVDFSIELFAVQPNGQITPKRPVVYRVRPDPVVRELKYKQTSKLGAELGGELQGGLGKLLAKVSEEESFEQNGAWYIKELYGYGENFSEAGWRLTGHPDWELSGDVNDLELVVRSPQGARLQGRFYVAAEIAIERTLDRWLTAAFGPRRGDEVVSALYDLSP